MQLALYHFEIASWDQATQHSSSNLPCAISLVTKFTFVCWSLAYFIVRRLKPVDVSFVNLWDGFVLLNYFERSLGGPLGFAMGRGCWISLAFAIRFTDTWKLVDVRRSILCDFCRNLFSCFGRRFRRVRPLLDPRYRSLPRSWLAMKCMHLQILQ